MEAGHANAHFAALHVADKSAVYTQLLIKAAVYRFYDLLFVLFQCLQLHSVKSPYRVANVPAAALNSES